MRSITTALALTCLVQGIVAGPHHGHLHKKRVLDIVTDVDVVYQTVSDVVIVTVTGGNPVEAATTSPAPVITSSAVAPPPPAVTSSSAVAPPPAVTSSSSVAPPPATTSAAPVVVSTPAVASSSIVPSVVAHGNKNTPAASVSTSVSSIAPVQTPTTFATRVASTSEVPSSTVSAKTAEVTASSSSSKRGLSFNDVSLLDPFTSSKLINWCYNWGSTPDGTVPSNFEYVPMLWSTETSATSDWSANAKSAIADGASHLLAFNEPDNSGQSNMSPSEAASGYQQYMNPFSGQAKLGAPAITNGGLAWLEQFLTACADNCDIDFVPVHWYDSVTNFEYFKQFVTTAYVTGGNRTLWITEFGNTDGDAASQNEFLQVVLPWLDQQDYVERYAYFMDETGVLLNTASELSTLGSTFMSYTSATISSLIADVADTLLTNF